MIDPPRLGGKASSRLIEFAVVVEIVNADLEASIEEPLAERRGHHVVAFRNEVEGGTETVSHFHFGQCAHLVHSDLALDVVGQDEGEAFAIRPSRPVVGGVTGGFIDRPYVGVAFANACCPEAPQGPADRLGHEWFHLIVHPGQD